MGLKIGKIYNFEYVSSKNSKPDKREKVLAHLTDEVIEKIINDLKENAQDKQTKFENRKKELAHFLEWLTIIKGEKEYRIENKIRRKTDIEKNAEAEANKLKAKFFPKINSELEDWQKARNLFSRTYDIGKIKMLPKQKKGIKAVYSGETITVTGKHLHKWYHLGVTSIVKDYIEGLENYIEIIEEK